MLNWKELARQDLHELRALYEEFSKEIFQMRTEFRITKKLDKPHLIKRRKKDRARILTLIHQRKVENSVEVS